MICPKCNKGELQEDSLSDSIGICDNIECGALFDKCGKEITTKYQYDGKGFKAICIYCGKDYKEHDFDNKLECPNKKE